MYRLLYLGLRCRSLQAMTGNTTEHVYARSGPDAEPGLKTANKTRVGTETKQPAMSSFHRAQMVVQGMKLSAEEP